MTSTATPAIRPSPIVSVRRESSRRDVAICRPLIRMKHAANTSAAPITGRGMIASTAANFGVRASIRNSPATA
jgi:hypothetical protein